MPSYHDNSTQRVTAPGFSPLLRNESPYYNNLNRPPKNAYDYADELNKILSYGGFVTKYHPHTIGTTFSIYDFVLIEDDETITAAPTNASQRVGIVVTSVLDSGEYWVCTFCPNFIFSSSGPDPFNSLSLQTSVALINASGTPHATSGLAALTGAGSGAEAIGKKVGPRAIFFCGSARIF